MNTRYRTYFGLAGWLLLVFLAGAFGAFFEPGAWYESLEKPPWTPPNWVFPVIWPLLYLCMGTAAWLVWRKAGFSKAGDGLILFFVQLAMNALWPWLFFGLHQPGTALAEIILLCILILFTLLAFRPHSIWAARLMLPYLLWTGYATALNFSIWNLN